MRVSGPHRIKRADCLRLWHLQNAGFSAEELAREFGVTPQRIGRLYAEADGEMRFEELREALKHPAEPQSADQFVRDVVRECLDDEYGEAYLALCRLMRIDGEAGQSVGGATVKNGLHTLNMSPDLTARQAITQEAP